MKELREYLEILDSIQDLLDNLPMLNYDNEIEGFYENGCDNLKKHYEIIKKRLEEMENSVMWGKQK